MDNKVILVTCYAESSWQEFTELTLREHSPKAKLREDDIKAGVFQAIPSGLEHP